MSLCLYVVVFLSWYCQKTSFYLASNQIIIQVEYEAEYERALVEVKDELREKEVKPPTLNYSNH